MCVCVLAFLLPGQWDSILFTRDHKKCTTCVCVRFHSVRMLYVLILLYAFVSSSYRYCPEPHAQLVLIPSLFPFFRFTAHALPLLRLKKHLMGCLYHTNYLEMEKETCVQTNARTHKHTRFEDPIRKIIKQKRTTTTKPTKRRKYQNAFIDFSLPLSHRRLLLLLLLLLLCILMAQLMPKHTHTHTLTHRWWIIFVCSPTTHRSQRSNFQSTV